MAVNKRRFIKDKVSYSCSMPGVWKAVAHSEGCVVVYHAPKACAHITEEMERNQYFRMLHVANIRIRRIQHRSSRLILPRRNRSLVVVSC